MSYPNVDGLPELIGSPAGSTLQSIGHVPRHDSEYSSIKELHGNDWQLIADESPSGNSVTISGIQDYDKIRITVLNVQRWANATVFNGVMRMTLDGDVGQNYTHSYWLNNSASGGGTGSSLFLGYCSYAGTGGASSQPHSGSTLARYELTNLPGRSKTITGFYSGVNVVDKTDVRAGRMSGTWNVREGRARNLTFFVEGSSGNNHINVIVEGVPAYGPTRTLIDSDNFAHNETTIQNTDIGNRPWVERVPDFRYVANRMLAFNGEGGYPTLTLDVDVESFQFEIEIFMSQSPATGSVILKYVDSDNLIFIEGSLGAETKLYKVVGGILEPLFSFGTWPANESSKSFLFSYSEGSVQVKSLSGQSLSGAFQLSPADAAIFNPSTELGLYIRTNPQLAARFDEFKVYTAY